MKTQRSLYLTVILVLLLAACQPMPDAPTGGITAAEDAPASQPTTEAPSAQPADDAGTPIPRTATLELLEGEVNWRAKDGDAWQAAQLGQQLNPGEQLSTGADGRAAVRFTEGTLTRLSPNSAMTLTAMSDSTNEPSTELKLDTGGLFIILNGGNAEIETNSGVASVRGSYLNVRVTPKGSTIATCLEGQCVLATDAGEVDLTNGQRSRADDEGLPPADPEEMEAYDFNLWFEEYEDALFLALDLELLDEEEFGEDCDFETGEGCEVEDPCDYETGEGCELDDDFCDEYDAAFCGEDGEYEDEFEFEDGDEDEFEDEGEFEDESGDDSGGEDEGEDDSGGDDSGGDDSGGDDEEEEDD